MGFNSGFKGLNVIILTPYQCRYTEFTSTFHDKFHLFSNKLTDNDELTLETTKT